MVSRMIGAAGSSQRAWKYDQYVRHVECDPDCSDEEGKDSRLSYGIRLEADASVRASEQLVGRNIHWDDQPRDQTR